MDTFYALSAPIRREILSLLSEGQQLTATAIADSFKVSPPAISQHLKVLVSSDLVSMHKEAQKRIYQLNPVSLLELENWAKTMTQGFDRLGEILDPKDSDNLARSKQ